MDHYGTTLQLHIYCSHECLFRRFDLLRTWRYAQMLYCKLSKILKKLGLLEQTDSLLKTKQRSLLKSLTHLDIVLLENQGTSVPNSFYIIKPRKTYRSVQKRL